MRNTRHRHCERPAGARQSRFLDCFVVILLAMTLLVPPAHAAEDRTAGAKTEVMEEKKEDEKPPAPVENQTRYAPDFCDFEITFPDRPYKSKKCPPESGGKCYDLTSYTMVYDHRTTVDVSVTCVPSSQAKYDRYNEAVIHTALKGMLNRTPLDEYKINTEEKNGFRHGSLFGSGQRGKQDSIYNAQLWVGQNSVMTVEAKLVGDEHHEADVVFGDILRSIHEKREPSDDDKAKAADASDLEKILNDTATAE